MKLNDRIRKIRKDSSFKNQSDFAIFLGTTRPAIASYELGKVIPNDTFLQLLCSKFNISFDWLKFGNGDMHVATEDSLFNDFAQKYSLSPAERDVARYCLELTSEQRSEILKHIVNIAEIINSSEHPKSEQTIETAITPIDHTPQLLVAEDSAPYNSNKTVKPAKRKMSTEMKQAIVNSELAAEKRGQMS